MKSREFFKVFAEGPRTGTVALAGNWLDRRRSLYGDGVVEAWEEQEWPLSGGELADYLADNIGFRICSDRLRDVLEASKGPLDVLQWLPVWIRDDDDRRRYWILHFPDPPDLLDQAKVRMLGGVIERNVLDSAKIEGHEVLHSPDGSSYCFLASAGVRTGIQGAGCTGMIFRRVEIANGATPTGPA